MLCVSSPSLGVDIGMIPENSAIVFFQNKKSQPLQSPRTQTAVSAIIIPWPRTKILKALSELSKLHIFFKQPTELFYLI